MARWAVESVTSGDSAGQADGDTLDVLVVVQMTVLSFIAVTGTFANALVFAVFYRRPTLRTISNR